MALHQQRDRAPAFRRQLQPPRRRHADAPRFADDRAERAMPQALLHQRQHLGIVRRLGIEHAFGCEPGLVQPGGEQVAPPHHPQHRAPGTRRDPGEEQRRRGVVAHPRAGGGDLVQRVEPQPAMRQPRIESPHPERQHLAPTMAVALDRAQRGAKGGDDARRRCGGVGHGMARRLVVAIVPILFSTTGESQPLAKHGRVRFAASLARCAAPRPLPRLLKYNYKRAKEPPARPAPVRDPWREFWRTTSPASAT